MTAKEKAAKKKFKTKIVSIGPKGAWSELQISFDVEKEWGSRARVSVSGSINGFAFRSSIFPDGKGGHTMMVNKAMQEGGNAGSGDIVTVEIEPDKRPRTITVPKYFKAVLAGNAKASAAFEGFSSSHRRAYVDWITQAKRAETRASRIAKGVVMIAAGEEADVSASLSQDCLLHDKNTLLRACARRGKFSLESSARVSEARSSSLRPGLVPGRCIPGGTSRPTNSTATNPCAAASLRRSNCIRILVWGSNRSLTRNF